MKILFLTPYPLSKGPNVRFRLECYLPYLETAGIRYKIRSFSSVRFYEILYKRGYFFKKLFYTLTGYARRFFHFLESLDCDAVCVLREVSPLGPAVSPYLWKLFGKRVIFDFDDAIYMRNRSQANRMAAFLKCPSKTKTFIRFSHRVIAGNNHLAEYAHRYHPNVTIIPTPIDTRYFNANHKMGQIAAPPADSKKGICLGWSGSWTTLPHFYLVRNPLKALVKRYPFLRIRVFGTHAANIPEIASSIEALDWSLESELEQLRGFDIGIMPLADDEWSRGKCAFKLLMYMSLGIPTVSSPIGVNTEIIRDGENGFLASSPEEWVQKLSLLIADSVLRQRIAVAGRRTVEERYSVEKWAPEFVKTLQQL